MAEEIKAVETVRLKSGGPVMTVSNVGDRMGTPSAWCIWFEKTKKQEGVFPVTSLVLDDGAPFIG